MVSTLQPAKPPRSGERLRVMVVDDTHLYRQLLSELLTSFAGVEVVGTASDGHMALRHLPQFLPDMLTLDVEMPVMNGLETLRHIQTLTPHIAVVMVSSHTSYGTSTTVQALEYGAFDFITKPSSPTAGGLEHLQHQLHTIVQTCQAQKRLRGMSKGMESPQTLTRAQPLASRAGLDGLVTRVPPMPQTTVCDIVVIGVSTGGPQALAQVIPKLPAGLRVPVVIVQHMPAAFTRALAQSLNEKSALTVVEGQAGDLLEPGKVYLAPGGKHMRLEQPTSTQPPRLCLTDDPPENHCKPSVDYLFRSVAGLYPRRALGVIMTGMGADGVQGLRLMKQAGATVIAQDQASCVVFGMPMEAIKAGVVDSIVPLEHLAHVIIQHATRR